MQPHVLDLSTHLGRSHAQPQRVPRREVGVHVAIQQPVRAASTLVLFVGGDGLLDARLRLGRAKLLLERCRAGSGGLHCSILPPLRSSSPLRWRRWRRRHGGRLWRELLSSLAYKSLQRRGVWWCRGCDWRLSNCEQLPDNSHHRVRVERHETN